MGKGTYFWDDHEDWAIFWGDEVWYNRLGCMVCEADFEVDRGLMFDLLGSRQHQKLFQRYAKDYGLEDKPIGAVIEIMKNISQVMMRRDLFPFDVIRAVDESPSPFPEQIVKFAERKNGKPLKGEMNLTPRVMICVVRMSEVLLSPLKLIHPAKNI
ncbi:MAG: hypothetical protein K9J17_15455 [Flavobacteriales bacterium]|nr:hypothetical protein [Flavobacteriales bacterium]